MLIVGCTLDASDMFVVAGLQIMTRLAYIQVAAHVAFQLVNARHYSTTPQVKKYH